MLKDTINLSPTFGKRGSEHTDEVVMTHIMEWSASKPSARIYRHAVRDIHSNYRPDPDKPSTVEDYNHMPIWDTYSHIDIYYYEKN